MFSALLLAAACLVAPIALLTGAARVASRRFQSTRIRRGLSWGFGCTAPIVLAAVVWAIWVGSFTPSFRSVFRREFGRAPPAGLTHQSGYRLAIDAPDFKFTMAQMFFVASSSDIASIATDAGYSPVDLADLAEAYRSIGIDSDDAELCPTASHRYARYPFPPDGRNALGVLCVFPPEIVEFWLASPSALAFGAVPPPTRAHEAPR